MATQDHSTSERNYIAFISYRHKPLDLSIAKKLHRRIERYVIPKELRGRTSAVNAAKHGDSAVSSAADNPQGKPVHSSSCPAADTATKPAADTATKTAADNKKLGLVFRDQDELPISNNLTENIRTALDHAEFLIVVCSPDTPESLWVQREITYFLEHHDRDHVLAILIDGDPDQSFPKHLTEVRDEDGNLIEQIEPLAANIVADSAHKRNKLFQTESLRILASLIGCPFDALYHREQRYRMRRIAIAAAAAALIAAGFIGMLLNRNAKIREQLTTSMINESKALAALSESAFRDGNYRGALEYALEALPGRNPDRPYVAEAEEALSDELYLYRDNLTMAYVQSLEQDTEISALALSADCSRMATGDKYGYVRVFDMNTGELLWSAKPADDVRGLYFDGETLFIDHGVSQNSAYSKDGTLIRQAENDSTLCVNAEKGMYLSYTYFTDGLPPRIRDIETGDVLYALGPLDNNYYELPEGAISPDGRYCAVLAKYAADEGGADLYIFDLEAGTRKLAATGLMYATLLANYDMVFDEDGNLILSLCGRDDLLADMEEWKGDCVTLYERSNGWEAKFTVYPDFGTAERQGIDLSAYLDYIGCVKGGVVLASRNRLVRVDTASGQLSWQKDLPGRVAAAKIYPGGDLAGLILTDGTITMCTTDKGSLSIDSFLTCFNCQYDIYGGVIGGDNLNGGKFAVISSRNRNRISVVSVWKNENLSTPSWSAKIPQSARFITSPSETAVAAVYNDSADDSYHVCYQEISEENAGGENSKDDVTGENTKKDVTGENTKEDIAGEYFTDSISGDFTISFDEYMDFTSNRDSAVLTDSGKVILSGKVYDFKEDGAVTPLSASGEPLDKYAEYEYASCIDNKSKKVITATIEQDPSTYIFSISIWEDGVFTGKTSEVPAEVTFGAVSDGGKVSGKNSSGEVVSGVDSSGDNASAGDVSGGAASGADSSWENVLSDSLQYFDRIYADCECLKVGAGGYVVVRGRKDYKDEWKYALYDMGKDKWSMMEYMGVGNEPVMALAGAKPWIATQKEDGTLCLIDLSDGGEILTMENTLPGESIVKLAFAKDDELLAAFAGTGALAIYSTKDGSELHHSTYSGNNLRFHSNARYEVHSIPQDNRILIICDDTTYTESTAIIIDSESMKQTGFYEGITYYFPSTNTVIVSHDNRAPCTCELFTVEAMQEKAEALLFGE